MTNLSIRNKLYVGFGLVILLIVTGTLFSYSALRTLHTASDEVVGIEAPRLSAVGEIRYLTTRGHLIYMEGLGDSTWSMDEAFASWNKASQYAQAMLEGGTVDEYTFEAENNTESRQKLSALLDQLEQLRSIASRTTSATGASAQETSLDLEFDRQFDAVITSTDSIVNSGKSRLKDGAVIIKQSYGKGTFFNFAVMVVALGISVTLTLWISRLIVQPLKHIVEVVAGVEKGDLGRRTQLSARDEITVVGQAINRMVDSIQKSYETLEVEKASIQRKVQDAVRESETSRIYLTGAVDRMMEQMERLEGGDLTAHLDSKEAGEIGRLFGGFNRVVANFGRLIGQVNEAVSDSVAGASAITSSSKELADGVQLQVGQANEVAVAVEEMVRTILDNARHAQQAADVAGASGKLAREGTLIVQDTIVRIQSIADVVKNSADTVQQLGASSQEIGEIVRVINDIADQTNLLALNAAIEAARAGEQGRGFAVVADEVRKLAERTTVSTKEIARMIKGIQTETAEAVQTIQKGNEEVNLGLDLAERAGKALGQLLQSSEETVDRVRQIAAASEQQSSTSEQIARSVDSINQETTHSASGINNIAFAAENLSRGAESLKVLVAVFRTDNRRESEPAVIASGRYRPVSRVERINADGQYV